MVYTKHRKLRAAKLAALKMIPKNVRPQMAHKMIRPQMAHCFSGSVEYARELVKRGYYFSFGGAVTFKNAKHAPEVIKSVPKDRIMLETDCPYMAPVPYRGKRNHPGYVPHIAAKIAELWEVSPEEVGRITTENALAFFGIKE